MPYYQGMKNYTTVYRLVHWIIAFAMLATLATILLRLTWLNKSNVSEIIQEYATRNDLTLSNEQSTSLAKKIRKPMWDWHIYTGYFLVGIFAIRYGLAIFGIMPIQQPWAKGLSTKERFKKGVYLVFYIFISISLITGMLMEFGAKEWKDSLESVHELSIYYLIAYLVLHMGGVLLAEFTNEKGIISRVISGGAKPS